ncbi:MAG TPA: DNA polymerase III subunit delta' [Candidatus Fimousia stercorigallinarum]|nr:DNA polymerase III subunit delta' [Candidatus Fimousia stercorigallinarum]
MRNFENIIGHEQNIEHLENAIENGQVSHAYIFNGEDGIGKMTTAKAFVKALLCESKNSCGTCQSCIQIDSGNHPDVIYVTHEKAGITVDDIRDQVNQSVFVKPYSSDYKVYIIDEADKMNAAAQNALLKTIEEPPAYAVIILLSNNKESFLETIVSRCVVLNFGPLKESQVREYLHSHYDNMNGREDLAVSYSMGNIGKAKKVIESDDFNEQKDFCLNLMANLEKWDIHEILLSLKQMASYKDYIYDLLDIMTIYYRDILILKVTGLPNKTVFKEKFSVMKNQSIYLSFEGIDTIIKEIEKAKIRLKANVNFDVTLELLLFVMKENGET